MDFRIHIDMFIHGINVYLDSNPNIKTKVASSKGPKVPSRWPNLGKCFPKGDPLSDNQGYVPPLANNQGLAHNQGLALLGPYWALCGPCGDLVQVFLPSTVDPICFQG